MLFCQPASISYAYGQAAVSIFFFTQTSDGALYLGVTNTDDVLPVASDATYKSKTVAILTYQSFV